MNDLVWSLDNNLPIECDDKMWVKPNNSLNKFIGAEQYEAIYKHIYEELGVPKEIYDDLHTVLPHTSILPSGTIKTE